MIVSRIFEELLPMCKFLWSYFKVKKKIQLLEDESNEYFSEHEYAKLNLDLLEKRLIEEHERAQKLDEKTTKTSIFIGMMVTVTLYFVNYELISLEIIPNILITLLLIYTFSAALLAMTGARTAPRYGFGTSFLLLKEKTGDPSVVVRSLLLQEQSNMGKYQINETTHMCMRNGAICIMLLISWLYYFNHNPYKDIEKSYQTCIHQDI